MSQSDPRHTRLNAGLLGQAWWSDIASDELKREKVGQKLQGRGSGLRSTRPWYGRDQGAAEAAEHGVTHYASNPSDRKNPGHSRRARIQGFPTSSASAARSPSSMIWSA